MELEHALGYGATYAPVALGMALPLRWLAGWRRAAYALNARHRRVSRAGKNSNLSKNDRK
jgi:hypothetical protein